MKIIIDAPFSDEEFIKFGKFLREMWKDTAEECFVNILEGTENKTKEELLLILKKIFDESDEFHAIVITKDRVEE
jgi:hypothetical protein